MGQKMGRLPDKWNELVEEKNRVLHLSSEILARVDDNIKNEDIFLVDYDNAKIDAKVDRWMENHKHKWETAIAKSSQEYAKNTLKIEITEIADDVRHEMRKDYQMAYAKMKKFTKWVDAIGINERKIHAEIQILEAECKNDPKLFSARLGPLRKNVFRNLRFSERMDFQDKRLRASFMRKVYDIDRKHIESCAKRIDRLVENFQTSPENARQ